MENTLLENESCNALGREVVVVVGQVFLYTFQVVGRGGFVGVVFERGVIGGWLQGYLFRIWAGVEGHKSNFFTVGALKRGQATFLPGSGQ